MKEFINEIVSYKLRGAPCPHCQNKIDIDIFIDNEGKVWVEELEKFKPKKYANRESEKSGSNGA